MKMPGGGPHRLAPGQVTDDSEMAISMALALASAQPPNVPLEAIAQNYVEWFRSGPFGMGEFCSHDNHLRAIPEHKSSPMIQ